MNSKEIEGAKQLIEIPDVKAGSYSFIGDSDVTYADVRILLDYIKDLEQENQKYKEVIDKINDHIRTCCNMDSKFTNLHYDYAQNEMSADQVDELLDILKEVK